MDKRIFIIVLLVLIFVGFAFLNKVKKNEKNIFNSLKADVLITNQKIEDKYSIGLGMLTFEIPRSYKLFWELIVYSNGTIKLDRIGYKIYLNDRVLKVGSIHDVIVREGYNSYKMEPIVLFIDEELKESIINAIKNKRLKLSIPLTFNIVLCKDFGCKEQNITKELEIRIS